MRTMALAMTLTSVACGKSKGEADRPVAEITAAVSSRLDALRAAVTALPTASTSLTPCKPDPDASVLDLATANAVLGIPNDPTKAAPYFAQARADRFFWEKLKDPHAEEQQRGVYSLRKLTQVALFRADTQKAPQVMMPSVVPGFVEGRLVAFDLRGVATCATRIRVDGPTAVGTMVAKYASMEAEQQALTVKAAEDLTDLLTRAVDVVFKPRAELR